MITNSLSNFFSHDKTSESHKMLAYSSYLARKGNTDLKFLNQRRNLLRVKFK